MSECAEFVISRELDAPLELIWKAWTERERFMQWFGPKGATVRSATQDLRPGGKLHYRVQTAEGREMWGRLVYREILPQERIVVVHSFSDEKGGITRHPLIASWPLEMLVATTFIEQRDKTTVTLHWVPLNATEIERSTFESNRGVAQQHWDGTFERLAHYLGKIKGE